MEDSKRQLQSKIDELDGLEDRDMMTKSLNVQRSYLKAELMETTLKEGRIWAQKCKAQWLVEGDENSHFFHRWSSTRKSKSIISVVESTNGTLLTEEKDIENEVIGYFTKLYGVSKSQRFLIEDLNWER